MGKQCGGGGHWVGKGGTIYGRFTSHVQEGSWAHGHWNREKIYQMSSNRQVTGTREPALLTSAKHTVCAVT